MSHWGLGFIDERIDYDKSDFFVKRWRQRDLGDFSVNTSF